jgi:hypothetical protein
MHVRDVIAAVTLKRVLRGHCSQLHVRLPSVLNLREVYLLDALDYLYGIRALHWLHLLLNCFIRSSHASQIVIF